MSLLFQNRKNLGSGWKFDDVRRVGSMERGQIKPTLDLLLPKMSDPLPKFEGFGIVTVAGGGYLRYLWAQVHKVRELSDVPIWCYHIGPKEIDHPSVDQLREMDVTFVDAVPYMERENYQSHHGYCAKSIAVIHSPFRHVCLMDADCIPIIDPKTVLEHPDYKYGFLAFPDIASCRPNNRAFPDLGLPYQQNWVEDEVGQSFIDKNRLWKALQLYSFMNGRPKPFHTLVLGDKCLLQLSCMKLGIPFTLTPKCEWAGYGIKHFLSDGTYAFLHYMPQKRGGPAAPEVADLLLEFDNMTLQPA